MIWTIGFDEGSTFGVGILELLKWVNSKGGTLRMNEGHQSGRCREVFLAIDLMSEDGL
jgi:hypothetical protein